MLFHLSEARKLAGMFDALFESKFYVFWPLCASSTLPVSAVCLATWCLVALGVVWCITLQVAACNMHSSEGCRFWGPKQPDLLLHCFYIVLPFVCGSLPALAQHYDPGVLYRYLDSCLFCCILLLCLCLPSQNFHYNAFCCWTALRLSTLEFLSAIVVLLRVYAIGAEYM